MKRLLKLLLLKLPLALFVTSVLWVTVLKWVPVYITPIMLSRSIEYRNDPDFRTRKQWTRLENISPEMIKAVITSEDNLFCSHDGFDRDAIKQAMKEKKEGKRQRGGSTISQQTAKNVFTFHKRTYWRKAVETWFTILIEKIWGKERIMEVYLNVAEMGKGIYGAQAAAQEFFGKDASDLTRREASTLAAVLPSPLKRNAGKPSDYVRQRSAKIQSMIPKLKYPEWVERKVKPDGAH